MVNVRLISTLFVFQKVYEKEQVFKLCRCNKMKKWITALGVLFIFVGFVVLSVQGITYTQTVGNSVPYVEVEDSWDLPPTYFKEGEILRVDFRVGPNWAWPPHDFTTIDGIEFPRVKILTIKVIDSNNSSDYNAFDVYLICPEPPYDPSQISLHPKIQVMHHGPLVLGTYTENQTGTVHYFTEVIGGIVRHNGNYIVQTQLYPDVIQNITPENKTEWIEPDPPANLYLYKATVESIYPYKFLLVVSPISMGVGIAILILSAKRKSPRY